MSPLACIALAVYFEARSEPLHGQRAVASVILNRVHSRHYPNTPCEVVFQRKQFSAFNNGIPPVKNPDAYRRAVGAVQYVLANPDKRISATHYHTVDINPYWAAAMDHTVTIGRHMFYD